MLAHVRALGNNPTANLIKSKNNDIVTSEGFANDTKSTEVTDNLIADSGDEVAMNFVIGVVPVTIKLGYNVTAGIKTGHEIAYGVNTKDSDGNRYTGMTAGISADPYLITTGYIAAGIGVTSRYYRVSAGVKGEMDFFNLTAPLRANVYLKPEFEDGDIAVNLYTTASLRPRLRLFEASLSLYAEGSAGKCKYFCVSIGEEKVIARFDPIVDMDFGNLIPLKPIKINLFMAGEAMKKLDY